MEATATAALPRWYWIVSILGLLWMLLGVLSVVTDLMMDEAALARMSEAEQQVYGNRPGWLFIVHGIAVFAGLGGVVGLLMRRSWAVALLALSLIAAVAQFGYVIFGLDAIRHLGAAATLSFPIVILAIGAGLLWLARHAKRLGWIG
ncbi:MAG TPA: hypothetical protein VF210_02310 [Pseudomonadales bacterium]